STGTNSPQRLALRHFQEPALSGLARRVALMSFRNSVPRDLRMKEKFLKHLTGQLSFPSPICNKIFQRLYNTTRDCTIPTHYKRCARLLSRLAVNPSCMDG
uniref:Uncharacterized protein n=1 Tax=Leptobrachium leishanense TaxID=445787 RepID=A0A8C5QU72_9ANUR